MADHIQILRRIGACENRESQPDWKGPEIPPCAEQASYLCETCGRLLCGGHAGGHWHNAADSGTLASHFQDEAQAAAKQEAALAANADTLSKQLAEAQAAAGVVSKVKAILAEE